MHVGFITADLSHRHGWAHFSLELITALQNEGVETTVISSRNTDATIGIDSYQILPNLVPRERFLLPKLLSSLSLSRQKLSKAQLIHCTVEPFAPLAHLISGKRPYIQSGVGSYLRINHWQRFPVNKLYQQAISHSNLVCISHYTAKVAREEFPSLDNIEVIPLGIDPSRFAGKNMQSVPIQGTIILTVGGIKERKGTIHIIRAMPEVRRHIPDAQCVIIGNPAENSAYTQQIRKEIDALNLHDCVHILGFVPEDQLKNWYHAADLFVLPSINGDWTFEGYGLVHMEASSAGLPVIGTYDCGNEDAIEHDITGLLVPQENIDEYLPKAMIKILSSPELARRMGEAGQRRAQTHTWKHVATQMIQYYESILKER